MASLTAEQREDLQTFLKDWLRHAGRTQTDLRRALKAASIRMPVLIDALQLTYSRGGLAALAEQLCSIDALWQSEDAAPSEPHSRMAGSGEDPLGQLDLLLEEIRADAEAPESA